MKVKFGHQALAWNSNEDKKQKGTFLFSRDSRAYGSPHMLLIGKSVIGFRHVELDPDADKFLQGDQVEHPDINPGVIKTYVGYKDFTRKHIVYDDAGYSSEWDLCRYPRKPKKVTVEDPHKPAICALYLYGDKYYDQGRCCVMDFWGSLSDIEKNLCREMVEQITTKRPETDGERTG